MTAEYLKKKLKRISDERSLSSFSSSTTPLPVNESGAIEKPNDTPPASRGLTTASSMSTDLEALGEKTPPEEWKPQKKEWLIMISLAIISLMVALDATVLVTVLPTIAQSLHGTSIDAFWAGTSYLLSSAVFQPVIASISEVFGRRGLLLISLFFFTLGTILCAIAHDFTVMLVGRSIQGIGGGGIITMSQVIFCDIVPLRQRPKYFALVLGSWSIGSIIGPVVGGAICENTTWRWCFYINFPFCGMGFVLAFLFVKLNPVAETTFMEKVKRTDWLGAFLFLGSMTVFLIGLSWGGIQHPWTSAATLAPIIVGIAGLVAFVFWQRYKAPRSLIPMSVFYCPSALAAFYCALINGLLLFTALYYQPFYFMTVMGVSATRSGVDLFPAVFLLIPGSIIVSILTTRLGRFRWAIWGGWAVTTLGTGLMLLNGLNPKTVEWATAMAIYGIGTGAVLTSVNVGIQAISKEEDAAMAACMYGFMRSLGMPIGVALSGTIFQNAMSSKLTSYGLPKTIAHDSERYVFVLRQMSPTNPARIPILESYNHGFHSVWIFMTCISASALLVSFLIRKFSMDKNLVSKFSAEK